MARRPDLRDVGEDPDPRFTLANERTFLAWIRTAMALIGGGLAAGQLLDFDSRGAPVGSGSSRRSARSFASQRR